MYRSSKVSANFKVKYNPDIALYITTELKGRYWHRRYKLKL